MLKAGCMKSVKLSVVKAKQVPVQGGSNWKILAEQVLKN